jgi:hypothetical protein
MAWTKTGKQRTIGVIIPNILNSFSPKYLVELADEKDTMWLPAFLIVNSERKL